jgi:hypothetical protein
MYLECVSGTYELYTIPKDSRNNQEAPEAMRGPGLGAVFVARNR